jgi:serine protease Do
MRRKWEAIALLVLATVLALGARAEGAPRANPDEGYLGVYVTDLTPEKAKQLRTPGDYGVLVMEVAEESPAAKAGIKENDVIIEFNGMRVEGEVQFGRLVRETPPGRTVPVKIVRDGKTQELKVTVGSRRPITIGPDFRFDLRIPEIRIPPIVVQLGGYSLLGVRVQDLTEQLGEYFGVPEGRGVLVTFVRAGSPAERAGLRAGDVIVAVGETEVRNVREFTRALAGREGDISLTIVRNKERQKLTVTLERRERPRAWYYDDQRDIQMDAYWLGLREYLRELQRYLESLERYEREWRERPVADPYRRLISTPVL